jgi:integrase
MKEYVFKPSRVINGKRVKSDYWYGRYTLPPDPKVHQVPLNTPDKEIARKRLREVVLEAQREQEGIIAPKAIRDTSYAPMETLVAEYESDLKGRGLALTHVRDTIRRLQRMLREAAWKTLADVRPDSFVKWRARFKASAKTIKEYQVSAVAFLNWLVRLDRLEVNPLAKVDKIDTRGKQVRESRAFTEDELKRLFAVAGRRLPAYLMLLYTGQRRDEVRSLVWGDLHLRTPQPYVLIRQSTTKDKDKRAVPLHSKLAQILREMRPAGASDTALVFHGRFPTYDSLMNDFKRAGIEQKDALGRVVHFHAFRKTWQTLGVRYGINQRAAQEVLGHSDPSLTSKAYTDVAALGLHSEIAKLPWIGGAEADSPPDAPAPVATSPLMSVTVNQMQNAVPSQPVDRSDTCHSLSFYDILRRVAKMVVGSGFEPSFKYDQSSGGAISSESGGGGKSPVNAPQSAVLADLFREWDGLTWRDKESALLALDGGAVA